MVEEVEVALEEAPDVEAEGFARDLDADEAVPALDEDLALRAEGDEAVLAREAGGELVTAPRGAGPLLDPGLQGLHGDGAGPGLDRGGGAAAHETEAAGLREVELHAVAVGEGQGGEGRHLARVDAPHAPEGLRHDA